MTDYSAARINMVDSQIHPMGVTDEAILDAYRTVPREAFLPEAMAGIAYCDEDLPLGNGRWMMEPVTHARLLQAARPVKTDLALDVAAGTGYSAAILSNVTSYVVAAEADEEMLKTADEQWRGLGTGNIGRQVAAQDAGYPAGGPYDVIFVNGAMSSVPRSLTDQLAPRGRLVAVLRAPGDRIGRAVLMQRDDAGNVSERVLFDAATPCLPGQDQRKEFVF